MLGGVDPAGPPAGVGEGTVFTGSVMACRVGAYEMFPDTDLDGVSDDRYLNLASFVLRSGVIVLPGEANVA